MESNKIFSYQYSAIQNREVEYIRKKYLPKEESRIEKLRKLDKRVQSSGIIPAMSIGIAGVLIFGIGMCFGLDVLMGSDIMTFLFGGIGVALMLPAYPMFRYIHTKTKKALAPEILRLADEIERS